MAKCNWSISEARAWVKEHEKKIAHDVSQAEIIDEIDYLTNLINMEGLNEEAKKATEVLVLEIERLTGNDIPDEDNTEDTTKESLTLLSEIIKEQLEVI